MFTAIEKATWLWTESVKVRDGRADGQCWIRTRPAPRRSAGDRGAKVLPAGDGGACSAAMASLHSLLTAHSVVLLIDSAAASVEVGLLRPGGGTVWRRSSREAGISIFEGVGGALTEGGIGVDDVGAFVFCEGPGSILGIRTAAMALRTWRVAGSAVRPAYAYRSLELVAQDLAGTGTRCPFAVIADARRDTWHFVEAAADHTIGPLQRLPRPAIAEYAGELFMPADFRAWTPPPRPVHRISYSPGQLWARQNGADLLRPAPQPDAFLHQESTYAAWTPQIHRAPRPKTP